MKDRTELPNSADPNHPWAEVTDLGQLLDRGRFWCASSGGHPGENDYPNPDLHLVAECQSFGASFEGVRLGLTGEARELELYGAARFRFGERFDDTNERLDVAPRIVLESYRDPAIDGDEGLVRLSLPLGEALRLARKIEQIVDVVTTPQER